MLQKLAYKNSIIAYHVYGSGTTPIFCFHGFSLSGASYEGLGVSCPKEKTMFALDFPFHGETEWREGKLEANDFIQIFELIYSKECGQPLAHFALVGHSMGGRICQYLYQCYADRVDKLTLLTPDGLKLGFWHRFMFRTKLGPLTLKILSRSSKLIMGLARFSLSAHLINKSLYNLVASAYKDPAQAHLVYLRLMATKHFYPNQKLILEKIEYGKTPVDLFFGKYDKIIPASLGKRLMQHDLPFVRMHVLLSGHMILSNVANFKEIVDCL